MMLLLSVLALTTGCALQNGGDYRSYLARKNIAHFTYERFDHCHGYGCRLIERDLQLSETDWMKLRLMFLPPIENAAAERKIIASAIAFLEQTVGRMAGTATDRAGSYRKLGDDQLDCVDESVNTTIYLAMLEQKGLLLFHKTGMVTARLPIVTLRLGPHQTAVIVEKQSGNAFAVDSWFHDNGIPPEIVPLDDWFFGWRPDA